MAKPRQKSAAAGRPKGGRLDATAWTSAGLRLLASSGIDAVRIDELARELKVTKGSFYWHFTDRAGLLQAMLSLWRRNATLAVIARLEAVGSPGERLHRLIDLPMSGGGTQHGQSLELAIRGWAKRDPQAGAAMEEIDQQRLAYLASLLRASGMAESKIGPRAYLIYAFILAEALISSKAAGHVTSATALRDMIEELVDGRPIK